MKVLKTIGLVFAKIGLVITILLFMLSLSTSFVLENGISSLLVNALPTVGESIQRNEGVNTEQVSEIDIGEVYNQILNELGITEEQLAVILESDVAKDLVNEFVEDVLEDISTGDTSDFDLGEKVLDFVEDNQSEIETLIGQPLPMEKIEKFATSEEVSQFNEQYKNVISNVSNTVPASVKNIVKILETFISSDFRETCLVISIVLIVVIGLLQWSLYKWIRTLGNTLLGVNIFVFIISVIGNFLSAGLTTLLNLNMSLEFGKAIISSAIAGGIGIVLLIIYVVIKKLVGKGDEVNEVSQNAC